MSCPEYGTRVDCTDSHGRDRGSMTARGALTDRLGRRRAMAVGPITPDAASFPARLVT